MAFWGGRAKCAQNRVLSMYSGVPQGSILAKNRREQKAEPFATPLPPSKGNTASGALRGPPRPAGPTGGTGRDGLDFSQLGGGRGLAAGLGAGRWYVD